MLLPDEMAVEGWPSEMDLPGIKIQGRHGRIIDMPMASLNSRTIRVSGMMAGVDKDDADAIREMVVGFVHRANPLKLYRHENDDKYMLVYAKSVDHSYRVGYFLGRVFTLSITLEAGDPFLYADQLTQLEINPVTFTPPVTMLNVTNSGGAQAEPVIWLYGKTSGALNVQNPQLTNYTTGLAVKYTGVLAAGEVLILDAARHNAVKLSNNIEHSGTAQGGGSDYITLAATASSQDGYYVDKIIKITGGTGAGQYRKIIGYNGTTKVATMATAWDTTPDATSTYEIYKLGFLAGYFVSEALQGIFSGAVPVINSVNEGYLINGFPLAPGVNQIEVEDENQLMGISILFRARWY